MAGAARLSNPMHVTGASVATRRTGVGVFDNILFTFESPAALFRVLSPKRWDLLERLQSLGPSSLRGLARSLERDVKRVHEDVAALIEVGLIEKTEHGQIHVPFEVIEADFELRAA